MASFITTIQSKLGYASQKALLLGAGFVTKPTVQILADAGVEVTIGKAFSGISCPYLWTPIMLTCNTSSLSDARKCQISR